MLYNNGDAVKMRKRVADSFPAKEMIVKVYESLCNYFEIGIGSGLDKTFAFDIADFCAKFKLPILTSYNALKLLQQAGYIDLTDEQDNSSRILFTVHKDDLYKLKQNPEQEKLIHILLRSYTGLFTDYAYINEDLIAKRLDWKRDEVYDQLVVLAKEHIIQYIPRKKTPFITFTHEREATERIVLSKETYEDRRDRYITRVKSVLDYAQEENICRSQILLSYFGEKNTVACGKCDVCLKKKEKLLTDADFNTISNQIIDTLRNESLSINSLTKKLRFKESQTIQVIRFLIDNGKIKEDNQLKLTVK